MCQSASALYIRYANLQIVKKACQFIRQAFKIIKSITVINRLVEVSLTAHNSVAIEVIKCVYSTVSVEVGSLEVIGILREVITVEEGIFLNGVEVAEINQSVAVDIAVQNYG